MTHISSFINQEGTSTKALGFSHCRNSASWNLPEPEIFLLFSIGLYVYELLNVLLEIIIYLVSTFIIREETHIPGYAPRHLVRDNTRLTESDNLTTIDASYF